MKNWCNTHFTMKCLNRQHICALTKIFVYKWKINVQSFLINSVSVNLVTLICFCLFVCFDTSLSTWQLSSQSSQFSRKSPTNQVVGFLAKRSSSSQLEIISFKFALNQSKINQTLKIRLAIFFKWNNPNDRTEILIAFKSYFDIHPDKMPQK